MAGIPDYFEFHRWANALLIDFCEMIDDVVLDAEMAGSVGTTRTTIANLVGLQNEHATILVDPAPASYFSEMPFPGWAALRERRRRRMPRSCGRRRRDRRTRC